MQTINFEKIAHDHLPALLLRALRLTCGDADRARDLVQDTFERCLRHLTPQIREEKILPWLVVVMRHLFIDSARDPGRRLRIDHEVDHLPAPDTWDTDDPPAWQRFDIEEVHAAVDTIPHNLKSCYQLHVVRHLSYREIARRLGIPIATIGTRIHRARRHLRLTLLNKHAGEPQAGTPPTGAGASAERLLDEAAHAPNAAARLPVRRLAQV
jgi:RNA polymerase sigma-70 factor, ECF subfamily